MNLKDLNHVRDPVLRSPELFRHVDIDPSLDRIVRSRHVLIPSKVDTGDPWILIVIRYQHSVEPFHEALAVPNRYNPFGFFFKFLHQSHYIGKCHERIPWLYIVK